MRVDLLAFNGSPTHERINEEGKNRTTRSNHEHSFKDMLNNHLGDEVAYVDRKKDKENVAVHMLNARFYPRFAIKQ